MPANRSGGGLFDREWLATIGAGSAAKSLATSTEPVCAIGNTNRTTRIENIIGMNFGFV
jgi:hypothetical protein